MALVAFRRCTCMKILKYYSKSYSINSTAFEKPSYFHQPGLEPLTSLTVGQLVDSAAERWPDREALVSLHQGVRLSFGQVQRESEKLAAGFTAIGLLPGDRVGILGPNSSQWYITYLAVAKAGLISVNINPAYEGPELAWCLNHVGVKALVAAESLKQHSYHELLTSILPGLAASKPGRLRCDDIPSLNSVIFISGEDYPGSFRYDDILHAAPAEGVQQIRDYQDQVQPDDGCNLQFTSGTTGKPKGTLLSHHNIVNNAYVIGKNIGLGEKHHRICLNVPFFHCFGNVIGILAALHRGATLVLPHSTFLPQAAVQAIRAERCTALYGTPTMYYDLVAAAAADVEHRPQEAVVEVAVNGGADCSAQLADSMVEMFGLKRVSSVYGMTETSPVSFQSRPGDSYEQMTTTVGHVHEHLEAKVVDGEGTMVPMGTPGELLVRGYSTMLGYWGDEARTRETRGADGWLKTGDQFVLHENGYGQVVGRIKDMIIRGGENIFPKEVEQFLETHPKIREVQVFGIPSARLGEEVCAGIRTEDGIDMSVEEIKSFCDGNIARFKIPKHITFLENFPKTVSGKIQKFRLRDMMMQKIVYESK